MNTAGTRHTSVLHNGKYRWRFKQPSQTDLTGLHLLLQSYVSTYLLSIWFRSQVSHSFEIRLTSTGVSDVESKETLSLGTS